MVEGGTAHGYEIKRSIVVSPRGAPLPVYKGVEEGEGRPSLWRALGGVRLPPGVGFPPLPSSRSRSQGKGREKRRKEGAQPLPLVQFGLGFGGGAQPLLSLSPKAQ